MQHYEAFLFEHKKGKKIENVGKKDLHDFKKWGEKNNIKILGRLHQESITSYLHVFLGNNDEMDTKMVQQWELFGDPTLEIY